MRKPKLTLISLLVTFLLFNINWAFAENQHSTSPSFKAIKLTDAVYMFQGKGGNLALIKGKQGLLLIDSDYKEMSKALKKELVNYGGVGKLMYLINTHWHGDHTEGNFEIGHHAQIIAHDNVRARLLTTQEIKLFKMVSKPYPRHALPTITYEKKMSLYINDEEIEIIYFARGHTDGDSIIFLRNSNIVHMGDHYFSGFFPFVDIANGGNVLNMAKNIKVVLQRINNNTKVIPGHGPLSNKKELQEFYEMLIGTSSEIKSMMENGMSLAKIQKKGLSKKWAEWTDGFISSKVWIGIVHNSLLVDNKR